MGKFINDLTHKYLFPIGFCTVLLSVIPYLILGENAIFPYHDQLDGELLAYIYQAKYLFSGDGMIPEFLGGTAKTALVPPAPLAVLLFRVLPPFWALLCMQFLGQVVGYVGMFRLAEQFTAKKIIAFVVAILYAFLPFLPVYGFSQYGMPLLVLSVYYLYRREKCGRSFLYVAIYGAMSSLVLCGFAILAIWAVGLLVWMIRKDGAMTKRFAANKYLFGGFFLLLSVYVVENGSLLLQMIGRGTQGVSHKSEYTYAGGSFLATFWGYLLHNGEHSEDSHIWILCLAIGLLAVAAFCYRKWEERQQMQCKYLVGVMGLIALLCLVAAFWDCSLGAMLKARLGTLGAFQLDRVLWLAPLLWVLALVLSLDILWSARGQVKWVIYSGSVILLLGVAVVMLKNSLVKPSVQKVIRPDYQAISYADYLAIGVMDQVEAFISETEGLQQAEYKVVSLGIDPAAALYHGFYCLDGYSNNYALEYKHAFRQIIAPELEKSDYLTEYFDGWGNRCYLFSSECPGYYTVEKGGFVFRNLEIDVAALQEMGGRYIFSAAYVMNAEEQGLELLREEAFETTDSYYRIFVYKIKGA